MKTIRVSLTNIDEAIRELDDYASKLEAKAKEIARRVALVGAEEVTVRDGGVRTDVVETPDGYRLDATSPAIYFLEFGTGAYVDVGGPYTDKVSVPVDKGSYSDTVGAHTWENMVVKGGMPEEEYPYNRHPKRGMYWSMRAMEESVKDKAREVFNE